MHISLTPTGAFALLGLPMDTGWSRRRLDAPFREEIGVTPKTAARIIRFDRATSLAGTRPWDGIALECGYYGQSHLVNDFRRVAGVTPTAYAAYRFSKTPVP